MSKELHVVRLYLAMEISQLADGAISYVNCVILDGSGM